MRADKNKLKSLILYIIREHNNQNLTETKLQKLLYFCDFDFYEKANKPLTGYTYAKNHFGPTVMELPTVLHELESEGKIRIHKGVNYHGTPQTTFSLEDPGVEPEKSFDESELLVIGEVNKVYSGLTPRQISNLSHIDFPYAATEKIGQNIEYDLVRYREEPGEVTEDNSEAKQLFGSEEFAKVMSGVEEKLGATDGSSGLR